MSYHKWTLPEEQVFREALVKFGQRWDVIQHSLLPHISIKSMKNKYYQKMHQNLQGGQEDSSVQSRVSDEQLYALIQNIVLQNQ
ncbi:Myb-like_DNA-binding domain-containing protein [Hexamita inflata]|uniref:Myb-like DNA-binding domain-containing protein n=1 Tax=Hexamita inflata TaxID=28002 RepID=A0AA86NSN8_9EUKA|nr:Myb-like DNA-binding domain-containing protein [Hexamita inflata]